MHSRALAEVRATAGATRDPRRPHHLRLRLRR